MTAIREAFRTAGGCCELLRTAAYDTVVRYRKATIMAVGVGAVLAIVVAIIDNVMMARLASHIVACPDPRCTRMAKIVISEPVHVLVAFALGFAVAVGWSLRRRTMNHG
jgi:hypothetical protein